MSDSFPAQEFNNWAATYDDSVVIDQFPFFGYKLVLEKTVALASACPGLRVLDLGTGTGNLALRFAALGCELWCTDFSPVMLEKARAKLPGAHFVLADLQGDWPFELNGRFERIVSAYVFHHFEPEEKIRIVRNLVSEHLTPGGRIIFADIAFPDATALQKVKLAVSEGWEDEFYWIASESIPALEREGLKKIEYVQVSSCAGVFSLQS
jgi:putative AdoMet-dependent methyltransferase